MISPNDLTQHLKNAFPDAHVEVFDKTGEQDHYIVYIRSAEFLGKNTLACHRRVQSVLAPLIQTGQLHASEIKTATPES
ncbi:MAG: BolA/IbaG family iron-sulfur metabolism protein [Vampirovibrio sp.]|jgi:stress-induced morphogen